MFRSANVCSSFADILTSICLDKSLDLMSLLKLLELDALAWIKVLAGPLSWRRGCVEREKKVSCFLAGPVLRRNTDQDDST